jgi:hypothetical protein
MVPVPETFDNATYWSIPNGTITPNAIIAPDGTLTGTLLTQSGATTAYLTLGNINIINGNTYTFSAYVKSASQSSIYILLYNFQFGAGVSNVYSLFNLATVSSSAVSGSPISQTITSAGNGWFRISLTATANSTTSLNAQFLRFTDPGVTSTIYCWGAQLELGSIATPYYPASTTPSRQWTDLSDSSNHATLLPNALSSVEVLVVAGGGAGGCGEGNLNGDGGGGGGGGGVVYVANFPVTSGTSYTVTVGDGGAGNAVSGVPGASGNNSIFGLLTAFGGGGGAGGDYTGSSMPGGSGGGASREGGVNKPGGIALGQGFSGGSALDVRRGAAGGGGAGGLGLNTIDTGAGGLGPGANGGPGAAYNISGTLTYYGGGGGGAPSLNFGSGTAYGGVGGIGGGGSILPLGGSGVISQPGSSGTTNTGGGGAGGYGTSGGNGGSGIVIVRYLGYQKATGGTVVYDGTYTTHTFTSVGSTTFQLASSAAPQYTTLKNGALTFNGSTHHLTSPNSASLCLTNELTINVWMYTTGATSSGLGLVAKGPETGDYDYMLYLTSSSTAVSFYKKNSAGVAESSTGYSSTFIGNWVNVCYTVSGTTCVGYINGTVVDTRTFTNAGIRVTTNPLRIGHAWGNVYYTGYLPVVQVYNRALSATEVTNNFMALRGRYAV